MRFLPIINAALEVQVDEGLFKTNVQEVSDTSPVTDVTFIVSVNVPKVAEGKPPLKVPELSVITVPPDPFMVR